nr:hypothetical protein [uncultured Campylobacter sp.]
MNIEILKNIKEATQNISSFFIFLFIYVFLKDIIEIIKFGFNIDDIRYILSFNDLLYASVLASGFLLLIYVFANKGALSFFIVFLCFIFFFIYNSAENMKQITVYAFIIMIFLKHELIYDNLQDCFIDYKTYINIALIISFFMIFFPSIFLFGGFEKKSINNKYEPEFLYRKDIVGRLLEPKFFSPAKLEKSYDFVEFKNSKVALDELNDIIMNDGKLPYFGFDGKFWVWFMQNNEKYRVFFILKNDKLTTIVASVLENDKFQIIKYLSKDVIPKNTDTQLESMSRLE